MLCDLCVGTSLIKQFLITFCTSEFTYYSSVVCEQTIPVLENHSSINYNFVCYLLLNVFDYLQQLHPQNILFVSLFRAYNSKFINLKIFINRRPTMKLVILFNLIALSVIADNQVVSG